jgi:peptidoglycan DL-endopeptidase LytF
MKKKDILFIVSIVNAGLLCLLFIIGVVTKEKKVPIVKQLDQTKPAMLQVTPILTPQVEEKESNIVYQLPNPPEKAESPKEKPSILPIKQKSFVEIAVVKNDTLEALAKKHHSSVEKIIAYNDLKTPLLQIGQILKIPPLPKEKKEQKIHTEEFQYYTVKVGDNPWTIALKHRMKVQELLDLNQLDDKKARKIRPGDKLRVR